MEKENIKTHAVKLISIVARAMHIDLSIETISNNDDKRVISCIEAIDIVATEVGFRCKIVKEDIKSITNIKLKSPVIVFFRTGYCMVLHSISSSNKGTFFSLEDPDASDEARLVIDKHTFARSWTGQIALLLPRIKKRRLLPRFSGKLMIDLALSERLLLTNIIVSSLIIGFITFAPFIFLQILFHRVLPYRDEETLSIMSLVIFVLILYEVFFGWVRRRMSDRLSIFLYTKLSIYVFNRLISLPINYFERTQSGRIIHHMGLLDKLRDQLIMQIIDLIPDIIIFICGVIVLFIINKLVLFTVILMLCLILFWVFATLPRRQVLTGRKIEAGVKVGIFFHETILGIRTIKCLALDARRRHDFKPLIDDLSLGLINQGDNDAVVTAIGTVLERLTILVPLALGVYVVLRNPSTDTALSLFLTYQVTNRLLGPINALVRLIDVWGEIRTAIIQVGGMINRPLETNGRLQLKPEVFGAVEFCDVSFRYEGSSKFALRNVSLKIECGMTVGIMGRSGSGKTTVTRLLQRLHSEYRGLIKIDGIELSDLDINYLRSSIGVVLQDNYLFAGTIRENIMITKNDATREEISEAARLAGAAEFIEKMPSGYETIIAEGAANLSGGQRQRIAIARVLVNNPRILIFDEATSALDAESEAIVNENISQIGKNRTVIIVSHRLAVLRSADIIVVLEQGHVYDIGSHDELMARCDIYSELWSYQNPEQLMASS